MDPPCSADSIHIPLQSKVRGSFSLFTLAPLPLPLPLPLPDMPYSVRTLIVSIWVRPYTYWPFTHFMILFREIAIQNTNTSQVEKAKVTCPAVQTSLLRTEWRRIHGGEEKKRYFVDRSNIIPGILNQYQDFPLKWVRIALHCIT